MYVFMCMCEISVCMRCLGKVKNVIHETSWYDTIRNVQKKLYKKVVHVYMRYIYICIHVMCGKQEKTYIYKKVVHVYMRHIYICDTCVYFPRGFWEAGFRPRTPSFV